MGPSGNPSEPTIHWNKLSCRLGMSQTGPGSDLSALVISLKYAAMTSGESPSKSCATIEEICTRHETNAIVREETAVKTPSLTQLFLA